MEVFMNAVFTREPRYPEKLAALLLMMMLAFAGALYGQHDKPSRSSGSSHQSAPPSHGNSGSNANSGHSSSGGNTPHYQSAPRGGSAPASNGRPSGNNTPAPNNGSNRGGSSVYNGNNRPGGNANSTSNSGNPRSTTIYNGGNNRPGGNNPSPNSRPGGAAVNGNNRPGGASGGGYNRSNSNAGNAHFAPKATIYHAPGGGQVATRADGSIREVRTSGGAVIHHAPDGVRRVEMARPGGRVVVATGHTGYVQRTVLVNNRSFVQRTYVMGGVSYARVYRPWVWGGVSFHVYTPMRFWSPGFYAYAWTPWARPVYYGWGWAGTPWYGYWGGWFTPYPYYTSPAFWLTDYLVATSLQDAYQARMDAAAAANAQAYNYGATPLTPDVKQAISDEVRRQLEQEKAEQANMNNLQTSGAPPLFSGGSHVFVVSTSLDVDAGGGQICPVTEGDVLRMNAPPPPNSNYAQVVVLASKGPDCRKGSTVAVALADLQEMQNQMRATIDQGLGELQKKQGQGGLPQLPSTAAAQPVNAPYAGQMQPDASAAAELTQATQEADRAEQDVVSQAGGNNSAPPATVTLGQSIRDVEAIMGKPQNVADLGSKKIYVYRDLKVTFVDGKVSDVQ
jgi:hypothetical protein